MRLGKVRHESKYLAIEYFHTEKKRIAVQENMSESQTLKTMVHEVAHSMLHNKEINRDDLMEAPVKDRNTKEVEAESVAYGCQLFWSIKTFKINSPIYA